MKTLCTIILLTVLAPLTYGQLVTWNLGGEKPTTGRELSIAPFVVHEGITVSDLKKGPLIKSRAGNARGFSGHLTKDVRSFDDAFDNNAFFEFDITVDKGYEMTVSKLKARLRVQEFSAKNFQWMYSLDGENYKHLHENAIYMSDLNNGGANQPTLDLNKIADLQSLKGKDKVTFRLYVWGNDNSQDRGKINVGFGKSSTTTNSPVLTLEGTVTKS